MILGFRPGAMGEGAAQAEAIGADFVFLGAASAYGPVGRDALSVAAYLMTLTRHVGLVAAISTSWQPFNVARALASFDLLSRGRCGWMALPADGEAGDNVRFCEHIEVVRKLFDSWDDDALSFDKAASVFADRDKVRRIRHAGVYFTVDGPLNAPRPPQGHPVFFQNHESGRGNGDVVLAPFADARPMSAVPVVLMEVTPDIPAASMRASFASGACDGFLVGGDIAPALALLASLAAEGPALPGDLRTRLGLARPARRDWSSA